jgi:hypothetical protein
MVAVSNPVMSWDMMGRYLSLDTEYSGQARQIIIKELGFEPDLIASYIHEIWLRAALRRFDEKTVNKSQLNNMITSYARAVKRRIFEKVPHQHHLIDIDEVRKTIHD